MGFVFIVFHVLRIFGSRLRLSFHLSGAGPHRNQMKRAHPTKNVFNMGDCNSLTEWHPRTGLVVSCVRNFLDVGVSKRITTATWFDKRLFKANSLFSAHHGACSM